MCIRLACNMIFYPSHLMPPAFYNPVGHSPSTSSTKPFYLLPSPSAHSLFSPYYSPISNSLLHVHVSIYHPVGSEHHPSLPAPCREKGTDKSPTFSNLFDFICLHFCPYSLKWLGRWPCTRPPLSHPYTTLVGAVWLFLLPETRIETRTHT